jgi:hypothetical protein
VPSPSTRLDRWPPHHSTACISPNGCGCCHAVWHKCVHYLYAHLLRVLPAQQRTVERSGRRRNTCACTITRTHTHTSLRRRHTLRPSFDTIHTHTHMHYVYLVDTLACAQLTPTLEQAPCVVCAAPPPPPPPTHTLTPTPHQCVRTYHARPLCLPACLLRCRGRPQHTVRTTTGSAQRAPYLPCRRTPASHLLPLCLPCDGAPFGEEREPLAHISVLTACRAARTPVFFTGAHLGS